MGLGKIFGSEKKVGVKNKPSWIEKIAKVEREPGEKLVGHCNNYSSPCCLGCDRCWGVKHKRAEKQIEG